MSWVSFCDRASRGVGPRGSILILTCDKCLNSRTFPVPANDNIEQIADGAGWALLDPVVLCPRCVNEVVVR